MNIPVHKWKEKDIFLYYMFVSEMTSDSKSVLSHKERLTHLSKSDKMTKKIFFLHSEINLQLEYIFQIFIFIYVCFWHNVSTDMHFGFPQGGDFVYLLVKILFLYFFLLHNQIERETKLWNSRLKSCNRDINERWELSWSWSEL